MKRKSLLFLLLFALIAPWAANAQEKSLTVYDGTATNNHVPMYVFYFDDFTRSQFVIPATELEAMATGQISAITYYTSFTTAYTTVSDVDIYVAEVANASISDFINKEDATIVYQGTVDFVLVDGKCQATITLPRPYTYNGGNLLIGCDNTTDAGYKNISFYGQSVTGASVAGSNGTSLSGVTPAQQDFIPKTTFTYTGGITLTCFRPENLQATALTTTTATLVWEDESVDPEWTLQYSTSNTFAEGTYTEMSVADAPTANLTGLTPATTYYARVKPNCDTEGNKWSTIATFITECEAITTYPWTENFDSYTGVTSGTTNNLPVCYNYINTCTYSSYKGYPVIYSASGYSHSGNNHLRFYTLYSSYSNYDPQDQYAILPLMENLNGKQLSLFARGANTNSFFKVGLMTDPTDASTFVEIATTTPTTSYEEYIYDLTGTGNYIAIMIQAANSSATSRTVYIDDITIDFPPACPKPTDVAVVENSVTAHTAQLSWVSEATSWEICLNGDEEHPIPANTNPFELTDLTEATAYTAKVRAVCDGTPGEWSSSTVSFTTPIACPAPTGLAVSGTTGSQTTLNWTGNSDSYDVIYRTAFYVDGFYEPFNANAIPDGWTKYSGLVDNVVAGTATLTTTTGGWNTNAYALGAYNAKVNVYGTSCKYWLVTPEINLSQNLSFDLALTDYGNADPIEDPTAQADDRFVVLIYADGAWTNLREWNNTGSEYVYNTIATTGENVTIDLAAYQGKDVKIAFYAESTVSGGDNDLHIDNVMCGIPHEAGEWQTAAAGVTGTTYTLTGLNPETDYDVKVLSNCEGETGHEAMVSFTTEAACMVPSELAVVSTTTTSAVLTWTSTSTAWQIQVDEENPIDVTENPYTLEGLDPSTIYTFKVRAYCSDGTYTEWSEPMDFATECDIVTTYPWEENFDKYPTTATNTSVPSTYPNDVLPICWQFLNRSTTSSTYPQVFLSAYSAYAVSGNCLFLKSSYETPLYAILPQFDEDIAALQLNFTYRNEGVSSSNGTLIVGYMTDPADATTFTAVLTCAQTTTKTEMEVIFAGAPTGSYIAFKYQGGSSNNYYLSIDNVVVTLAPTCLKPTDLAAVAAVNSATLSWTANSEETEWTIYYREVTNEPGEYIEVSGVTDNPYLLDNVLEANTQYEFYVVANCSADDASEPSDVMSFYTKCDPVTDFPWTEDFEEYNASSSGVTFSDPCWENIHLAGTGTYFFEVYSGTNGTNSTKQLRLHDMSAGTLTKLTLPGMTLPDDNYEFVIDVYRSSSYTNKPDEGIRVYASTNGEIEGATELAFIPRLYSVESGVIPAEETGNAWYTYHLPLGFSGTCYIILRGESQFGTATYMDNFMVQEIPVSTVTQTIELTEGWNWVSIYLEIEDPEEMMLMLQEALGENGLQIVEKYDYTTYADGEWGDEGELEEVTNEEMYMIETSAACTVELQGLPADPTEHVITIEPGWNWIGFPSSEVISIEDAFADFEAEDDDMIVGKFGYTTYVDEWGDEGDLEELTPGQGYMYFSNSDEPKTLIFQTGSTKAKAKNAFPTVNPIVKQKPGNPIKK